MNGDEAEPARRRGDDGELPGTVDDAAEDVAIAPLPPLIPLAPLRAGELYLGAIRALRANPRVMFGLTAVVVAVMNIVSIATQLSIVARNAIVGGVPADADAQQVLSAIGLGSGWSVIGSMLGIVGTLLATGIVTVSVARAVLGRKTRTATALRSAGRRLPTLIALGALEIGLILMPVAMAVALTILGAIAWGPDRAGIVTTAAVAACVLAVFAMWPLMAIAPSAVMLERRGPVGSLGRALDIQWRGYWRLLGRLVLSYLIAYAVGVAVWLPFWLAARWIATTGGGEVLPALLVVLGSAVGQIVTLPFLAAVNTLLYVDQRIRNEGLGPEFAQVNDQASSTDAATLWRDTVR